MKVYVTREGDRLDQICVREYGMLWEGLVEYILSLNPGLASKGEIYPAGIVIKLPFLEEIPLKPQKEPRLWNYASKFQA